MKAWLGNAVVTAAVAERLCPQLRIDCLQLALQCRSYDRSCGEIVSAVADRLPAVADRLPAVAEEAGRVSLRCIVREGIVLQLGEHATRGSVLHVRRNTCFPCASVLSFFPRVMCVMPCPGVCHFGHCGSKSGKHCGSRNGPRSGGFLTAVADGRT